MPPQSSDYDVLGGNESSTPPPNVIPFAAASLTSQHAFGRIIRLEWFHIIYSSSDYLRLDLIFVALDPS